MLLLSFLKVSLDISSSELIGSVEVRITFNIISLTASYYLTELASYKEM